jgi:hypothetical protein
MARVYDYNDLTWTSRGDFVIGHDGDLSDTYADPLRSLFQEIRTRVMSDIGDWLLYQDVGASVSDFVGEPNNKITAEAVKTRIIASVCRHGLIARQDVSIKYMPVDIDQILFRVSVDVAPTARNAGSAYLQINLLYNYAENNVYTVI